MNKCPYCNNKVGFYTVVKEVIHQFYDWNGAGTDSSCIKSKETKQQRCLKCNRIVHIKLKD